MHRCHRFTSLTARIPRKAKGNISLLVIFVLLSSSLIALLAMSQIKNLMVYGGTTYNYFRAHYLAKAGLELALTEVAMRDAGFSISVASGDSVVIDNFLTEENSGFEPYFQSETRGAFLLITNNVRDTESCSNENKIVLPQGGSRVIPLFIDSSASSHVVALTTKPQLSALANPTAITLSQKTEGNLIF